MNRTKHTLGGYAIEAYERRKGVQVSRPGHPLRGRTAVSYYKFKAFLKQFDEVGGKLKKLPKGEPWLNCVGLVDLQPNDKGDLQPVRKAICIYVWDTKNIVSIIEIPDGWYLKHKKNEDDNQDFESIFVTKRAVNWLIVNDPIPGPIVNSF